MISVESRILTLWIKSESPNSGVDSNRDWTDSCKSFLELEFVWFNIDMTRYSCANCFLVEMTRLFLNSKWILVVKCCKIAKNKSYSYKLTRSISQINNAHGQRMDMKLLCRPQSCFPRNQRPDPWDPHYILGCQKKRNSQLSSVRWEAPISQSSWNAVLR